MPNYSLNDINLKYNHCSFIRIIKKIFEKRYTYKVICEDSKTIIKLCPTCI